MPELRDATPNDIPAIRAIYAPAVEAGTASFELTTPSAADMQARMRAVIDGGYPYRVYVDDNGIVAGYAYASAYRPRPAYRWTVEDTVYVHPDHHGHGIGRALLGDLIDRCTEQGFRRMIAVIGGDAAEPSIALHRALGFETCGLIPKLGFKHGRWLDSTVMQRALGAGDETPPDAP